MDDVMRSHLDRTVNRVREAEAEVEIPATAAAEAPPAQLSSGGDCPAPLRIVAEAAA
jgi:hypothetical protein